MLTEIHPGFNRNLQVDTAGGEELAASIYLMPPGLRPDWRGDAIWQAVGSEDENRGGPGRAMAVRGSRNGAFRGTRIRHRAIMNLIADAATQLVRNS